MRYRSLCVVMTVAVAVVVPAGCQRTVVDPEATILHSALEPVGWQGWDTVQVIAHRGFRCCFPENTLEAIDGSVQLGAGAVELDVSFTRDGIPVLLHDETLDRTTDRTGVVAQMSWQQLANINACPGAAQACLLPTVTQALARARGRILVVLDLKGMGSGAYFGRVSRAVRLLNMTEDVAIISYDLQVLALARTEFPDMPLGYYFISPLTRADTTRAVERVAGLSRAEIFLRASEMLPDGAAVDRAAGLGLPISAFTARNRAQFSDLRQVRGIQRVLSDVPQG